MQSRDTGRCARTRSSPQTSSARIPRSPTPICACCRCSTHSGRRSSKTRRSRSAGTMVMVPRFEATAALGLAQLRSTRSIGLPAGRRQTCANYSELDQCEFAVPFDSLLADANRLGVPSCSAGCGVALVDHRVSIVDHSIMKHKRSARSACSSVAPRALSTPARTEISWIVRASACAPPTGKPAARRGRTSRATGSPDRSTASTLRAEGCRRPRREGPGA